MILRTLTIVGVGLIGGSIALAARARGVAGRIVGVGPRSLQLENALQHGMIDACYPELGPAVGDADAVVVCTPVDHIADQVVEIAGCARSDTLITDVGSTKAFIVNSLIGRLPGGARFVGGHPLAGSEKSGLQFADARLFEGRLVVLTPSDHFHPDAVAAVTEFWKGLGARVKEMTPEDHDRAVAITSHLPHLVAAALAGMLPADLRELVASGFRDTTRVAGGDPCLWTAIFQQNEAALRQTLDKFQLALGRCFNDGDRLDMSHLQKLLAEGKRNRDALGS
jgi:cyclohexadieny/prephenate dehydrogenase